MTRVPLDLKSGVNRIRYTGITAHAEPDSVILRDPSGKIALQILEQNYLADPVSMDLLLSLNEGKTIEFQTNDGKLVTGRIIRAGSAQMPGNAQPASGTRRPFFSSQPYGSTAILVEVDGKLRFGLPGTPLLPASGQ